MPRHSKEKRRSPVSKNEVCHELSKQAGRNRIPFRCVLFEVWFAAAETLIVGADRFQLGFHIGVVILLTIRLPEAVEVATIAKGNASRPSG